MSVKRKLVISAATLTLVGGAGAAVTLTAHAATSACDNSCTNLFNAGVGTGNVIEVLNQAIAIGQPVDLATASGANQGEDFQVELQGAVSDAVAAGLMDPTLGKLYGNLPVSEIEYKPGGIPSGLCVGVESTPRPNSPVTLRECGASGKTLWIFDPVTTAAGSFLALINGATDKDFNHVESLTTDGSNVFTFPLKDRNDQLWGEIAGTLPS
jgi:hypothetical protein